MNNFLKLLPKRDDRCQQKKGKEKAEKYFRFSSFVFPSRFVRITFSESSCSSRIFRGIFHRYQNSSHFPSIFWSTFCVHTRQIRSNCKAQASVGSLTRNKSDRFDFDSNRYHHHQLLAETLTFFCEFISRKLWTRDLYDDTDFVVGVCFGICDWIGNIKITRSVTMVELWIKYDKSVNLV